MNSTTAKTVPGLPASGDFAQKKGTVANDLDRRVQRYGFRKRYQQPVPGSLSCLEGDLLRCWAEDVQHLRLPTSNDEHQYPSPKDACTADSY